MTKTPAAANRVYQHRHKTIKRFEAMGSRREPLQPLMFKQFVDTLRVPLSHPKLAGKPLKFARWQWRFLNDLFKRGLQEVGLSVARKNGKSSMLAAALLWQLLHGREGWRCLLTSDTGEHSAEVRRHMRELAESSGYLDDGPASEQYLRFFTGPQAGRAVSQVNGAEVHFLTSGPTAGQAGGADWAIIDEAGLLGENQRELWNSLYQAVSARSGRFIAVGVQGRGPMFKELRDREKGSNRVSFHHYGTDGANLDDREAWKGANPGLGTIKSFAYMEAAAEKAQASQLDETDFRLFDLNEPVEKARELICSLSDWRGVVSDSPPPRTGRCFFGFDLGGSRSMTAAAAVWENGRAELFAAFPDDPDLAKRGEADNVGRLYTAAQSAGELATYPGKHCDAGAFLLDVMDALQGEGIVLAGADRYRQAEVEKMLQDSKIQLPMVFRGTGAGSKADGSFDVRAFDKWVTTQKLRIKAHLLAANSIKDSRIRYDSGGNPALDKSGRNARVDLLSALLFAVGLCEKHGAKPRKRPLRAAAV